MSRVTRRVCALALLATALGGRQTRAAAGDPGLLQCLQRGTRQLWLLASCHLHSPLPAPTIAKVASRALQARGIALENLQGLASVARARALAQRYEGVREQDLPPRAARETTTLRAMASALPGLRELPLAAFLLASQSHLNLVGEPVDRPKGIEVEGLLRELAAKRPVPLLEVEGPQALLAFFNAISVSELEAVAEATSQLRQDPKRLRHRDALSREIVTSYPAGQLERLLQLERALRHDVLGWPDSLVAKFLDERNTRLTATIEQLAEGGQADLFAIGAAHLAGAQGVLRQLIARGWEPLEPPNLGRST